MAMNRARRLWRDVRLTARHRRCSNCGQRFWSPPCCKTPQTRRRADGFHTIDGGGPFQVTP